MKNEQPAVLIVDDDPGIREITSECIRDELGCDAYVAGNGREALDVLARMERPPCLILLDLMMPIMNGHEFMEALAKDDVRSRIPVTVMSASRSATANANGGVLHKPFTVESLRKVIRAHCKHEATHGHAASALSRVAVMLRQGKESLIQAWTARARQDPKIPQAQALSEEDLRDNIPQLLDDLIASLEHKAQANGPSAERGHEIGGVGAREHARHRVASGYTLAEELREMVHLRTALIDMCARAGVTLAGDEAQLLHAAFDEVMICAAIETESETSGALRRDIQTRELFIAILGHDLRTPLGTITLASSRLLSREDVPEGDRKDYRRIALSADRMKRLIDDLLDMARARHAGLPIVREPLDFRSICEDTIAEVEFTYADRSIVLDAPEKVPGECDRERSCQLVSNLTRNALDYSPAKTPVTLRLRDLGETIELEVHNQGAPIPRELLPTIFDPFVQAEAGADCARHAKGLGLGLFIAKEIAEAHGGSIRVASAPNDGTTFTVTMPRAPALRNAA